MPARRARFFARAPGPPRGGGEQAEGGQQLEQGSDQGYHPPSAFKPRRRPISDFPCDALAIIAAIGSVVAAVGGVTATIIGYLNYRTRHELPLIDARIDPRRDGTHRSVWCGLPVESTWTIRAVKIRRTSAKWLAEGRLERTHDGNPAGVTKTGDWKRKIAFDRPVVGREVALHDDAPSQLRLCVQVVLPQSDTKRWVRARAME